MVYDLHCHSNCSDGELNPIELISHAHNNGVSTLSITDHDTLSAFSILEKQPSISQSITIIPGIEISTQWQGMGIHILGLNINPHCKSLIEAVEKQYQRRQLRAEKIAYRLEKLGVKNALEGARAHAGTAAVSRPHFAKYMVDTGFCKNIEQAFKKYLGPGKPGDVKLCWPEINSAIKWIKESGGIAILAHPQKYKLTRSKLIRLLDDFQVEGGVGIEVLSGKQEKSVTDKLVQIAQQRNLLASLGSDFHSPKQRWAQLGMHLSLPTGCTPVWDKF